jgi:hypothetical protein
MVFRYGLSNLPLEPPDNPGALLTDQPDDPSALYSPADIASIGMQRAGQGQVVPARFGFRPRPGQGPLGPFPNQGGLAPGGGQLPDIPIPEAWKTLWPMLQLLPSFHPMAALGGERRRRNAAASSRSRAREEDGDWCHQRYQQEYKECQDNRENYAHPDFEDGCKKRATERWDKCNRNGGRPPLEELNKWGKADEDIYFETDR